MTKTFCKSLMVYATVSFVLGSMPHNAHSSACGDACDEWNTSLVNSCTEKKLDNAFANNVDCGGFGTNFAVWCHQQCK